MLRTTARRNKPAARRLPTVPVRHVRLNHRPWHRRSFREQQQACRLLLLMVSVLLYYVSARILWSAVATDSDNHAHGPKKGDFDDTAAPHAPCDSYCSIGDMPG